MAEVVIDVPKGTSDGSPGVQDVFESLYWLLERAGEPFELVGIPRTHPVKMVKKR